MDTIAITVDCAAEDFDAVTAFWAETLGYRRLTPGYLVDPEGVRPRLSFDVVPEPKVAKNRWHLDLYVDDLAALEPRVRTLVGLGATVVRHFDEEINGFTNVFTTMLDPGGNEFCVCAPHIRIGDAPGSARQ